MTFATLHRASRWFALALFLAACSAASLAQPKIDDKDKKDDKDKTEVKETNLAKALRLFQENKGEEANKALQDAVKEDPKIGTPRLQIVRWLLQSNKPQDARAQLEQAMAESPNPVCYLVNASVALAENRISDAILSLERAQQLVLIPGLEATLIKHVNDESLSGLAMAYERRNDWSQVKNYLMQFDSKNPGNPQILLRLARACFLLNQGEEASKYLQAAYEKDKGMDPPELIMAQFWASRGTDEKNKKDAEEAYGKAKAKYDAAAAKTDEEREKSARVYRSEAEWMLSQGNLKAAQALLQTVTKLQPDARETLALQGLMLRHEGKSAEAAEKFVAALAKNPSYPFALANAAVTLCQSEKPEDKIRGKSYAELYQKNNTQNPDGYAVLGYCCLRQDPPQLDQADQALAIPLRAGPVSPDTAYYIALLLVKREQYDRAVEMLDKALKNPTFLFRTAAEKLLDETKPKVKKTTPTPSLPPTPAPKP